MCGENDKKIEPKNFFIGLAKYDRNLAGDENFIIEFT